MKNLVLFLFVTCFNFQVAAQTNLDSLYAVWEDVSKNEAIRVAAYQAYINEGFLYNQPDTVHRLTEKLHNFAKQTDNKVASITAYTLEGIASWLFGDHRLALRSYQKAAEISQEIGDFRRYAANLTNIGTVYFEIGNYSKSLIYFERSLSIQEEHLIDDGSNTNLNIGALYQMLGNYSKALEYLERSLAILQDRGDERGVADCLNNIGIVHQDNGNLGQAQEYLEKSLAKYRTIGSDRGISTSLGNLGLVYKDLGDHSKALDFFLRSLAISEKLRDKSSISNTKENLGRLYQIAGDHSLALEYCNEALSIAVELEVLTVQLNCCQCLYDSYKALGNGNEALIYLEKSRAIEASINAEEAAKQLQQMEFEKEMLADSIANAEEARLVDEAHKEEVRKKNKTRNALIGGGLFLFLIAGGIYSRLRYTRKAKAEIEKEKDRSENLLLNILPADIAAELKEKGRADARDFETVSILFTDFKGFTAASEKLSAQDLVSEINTCFEAFDGIMGKYGIEKIKTIGDAYMAAGGLPVPT